MKNHLPQKLHANVMVGSIVHKWVRMKKLNTLFNIAQTLEWMAIMTVFHVKSSLVGKVFSLLIAIALLSEEAEVIKLKAKADKKITLKLDHEYQS